MTKKDKRREGIVYSTNPEFEYQLNEEFKPETLHPEKQQLRILLDKKARAGKQVTLITGFIGKIEDLEELTKKLKTFCGVGGSCKDSEIILQGDLREKAESFLLKQGFKVKKI